MAKGIIKIYEYLEKPDVGTNIVFFNSLDQLLLGKVEYYWDDSFENEYAFIGRGSLPLNELMYLTIVDVNTNEEYKIEQLDYRFIVNQLKHNKYDIKNTTFSYEVKQNFTPDHNGECKGCDEPFQEYCKCTIAVINDKK